MFRMKTPWFQCEKLILETVSKNTSYLCWYDNYFESMDRTHVWKTLEIFLKVVSDVGRKSMLVKLLQGTIGWHWIITLSIRKIENQNRRNLRIPNASSYQNTTSSVERRKEILLRSRIWVREFPKKYVRGNQREITLWIDNVFDSSKYQNGNRTVAKKVSYRMIKTGLLPRKKTQEHKINIFVRWKIDAEKIINALLRH